MKTLIAVVVTLAIAAGAVYTQTPLTPQPDIPRLPTGPAAPNQPRGQTIDQILDDIERLRAQRAELEKQEQELVKEVRKKLDKQSERTKRMGILELPPTVGSGPVSPPSGALTPTIPPPSVLDAGKPR